MTREEFRSYVEFLRSQNKISYDIYSGLIDGIDTLEQEPKTGQWIEDEYDMLVICSKCGEYHDGYSKYCPNCGARMIESQESEK